MTQNSELLNNSKDSTQFWHRSHKVLGTKKGSVIEPLYNNALNTYIFKANDISNILYHYHINKNTGKAKMIDEFENIL